MKVLVAGAGAIGQWLGLRLADGGHDVTLLGRPVHIEAARAGLRVRGHTQLARPLAGATTPQEAGSGFDAVAITAKAHQTAALAEATAPLLGRDGFLFSLQNGLGNAQKMLRFVPAAHVAVALTSHGVMVEGSGRLYHAGIGPTLVGPAMAGKGSDGAAQKAQALLTDARLDPEWHDDMRPFVWRKAIVNAGINPVGALHRLRNGAIAAKGDLLALAGQLVTEGVEVARRAGVALPPGDLVEAMHQTLGRTSENKCSMLQDVEAKRPTEIEQITGRLVRLGARLDVTVPDGTAVYRRIKELEAAYLGADAAARMTRDELAWESDAQ